MQISDFLSITIVGAGLSLAIEGIKAKFGVIHPNITKALTIGLAIVIGFVYVLLRETIWWETIMVVLGAASTVYAIFLNQPDR